MPKVSEAHREARRLQIVSAAVECFARQGFHRTSMKDIIKRSRMSAGAIYGYFGGKDDIVAAIAADRHAREAAMLAQAIAADDLAGGMRKLARDYFDWLGDPEEKRRRLVTVQVWAEALRSRPVAAIVREGMAQRRPAARAFRAARERGELASDLDPDAVARFMLAVIQGFILQQAWEPDVDADAFLKVVERVIGGLFDSPIPRKRGKR